MVQDSDSKPAAALPNRPGESPLPPPPKDSSFPFFEFFFLFIILLGILAAFYSIPSFLQDAPFIGETYQRGRTPDKGIIIQPDLKDIFLGSTLNVKVRKTVVCDHCSGSGSDRPDGIQTCESCQGRGLVRRRIRLGIGMQIETEDTCPVCRGEGKMIKNRCHKCGGHGVHQIMKEIPANIPPGCSDGTLLTIPRESDEVPHYETGDLILKIEARPHTQFKRIENHLQTVHRISLLEALVGFEHKITHLDSRVLTIKKDDITSHGEIITIVGEGMPAFGDHLRGDLRIEILVKFPFLTDQQQKDIARIFDQSTL